MSAKISLNDVLSSIGPANAVGLHFQDVTQSADDPQFLKHTQEANEALQKADQIVANLEGAERADVTAGADAEGETQASQHITSVAGHSEAGVPQFTEHTLDATEDLQKAQQVESDASGALQEDPAAIGRATTDVLNGLGDVAPGATGNVFHQAAGPGGDVAAAAAGVAEGDPAKAGSFFTAQFHELGGGIGGDAGHTIDHLAPGLGQAAGDIVTIGVSALDGNDEGVANGATGLANVQGDVLSSAGHWAGHELGGSFGDGVYSTTDAVDQGSQTVSAGSRLLTDFQNGDPASVSKDLSGVLHHGGDTADSAGNALEDFGHATHFAPIEGLTNAAGGILHGIGDTLNGLGDLSDKGGDTVKAVASVATLPEQLLSGATSDLGKTAYQVGNDLVKGFGNAGDDLLHGRPLDAVGDLGKAGANAVSDGWDGIKNIGSDGWDTLKNAGEGLAHQLSNLFSGGSSPQTSEFQDLPPAPTTLPPGVQMGYGAPDSDGNLTPFYVADDGNTVNTDPSTGLWTEYDGDNNPVMTYQWDPSIRCWTKTDAAGNEQVFTGSDVWVPKADVEPASAPLAPHLSFVDYGSHSASPAVAAFQSLSIAAQAAQHGIDATTNSPYNAALGAEHTVSLSSGHGPNVDHWSMNMTPVAANVSGATGNLASPFGPGTGPAHGAFGPLPGTPEAIATASGGDDNTPHLKSAGAVAVDHLADTVSQAVGGTAGAMIDTLGHALDGVLGNVAAANPAALSAAEAHPQTLADMATAALNNLSGAGGALGQAAAVSAALHGDLDALTTSPASGADATPPSVTPPPAVVDGGQHDATTDAASQHVPPVPTAGQIAVDHLADDLGHTAGGVGGLLDSVGHLLAGGLGNALDANPAALSEVETHPQTLTDEAATALHNLSEASPAQQAADVLAALHGDLGALTTPPAQPIDQAIRVPPPVAIATPVIGQHDFGPVGGQTSQPSTGAGNTNDHGLHGTPPIIEVPTGTGTGGGHSLQSFWDQAADAIHHATGSGSAYTASMPNYGLAPNPVSAYQSPGDTHSTGLGGEPTGLGFHPTDVAHTIGPTTDNGHGDQAAYPHFELPTLHPSDGMHH